MVIFHSHVSLPEGVYIYIYIYTYNINMYIYIYIQLVGSESTFWQNSFGADVARLS